MTENNVVVMDKRISKLENAMTVCNNMISQAMEDIRNHDQQIQNVKDDVTKNSEAISQIAADSVILGNQNYTPQYRVFSRKANRRIHELVGGPMDDSYILFQPFFRSGIYKDISDALNISSWKQISMVNYTDPNSDYNSALHMIEIWKPKHGYFIKRVNDLIEKRDNGVLATERCRALTRFLRETNNATDVPFLS